jgi:cleavage and polyadenylation specificity factor subunit 2
MLYSHASTVDLVLLSHGDLSHTGLYAYAYSRWNLKAPTYATLPVQAMGRIALIEEVEDLRDEQDIGDNLHKKDREGVMIIIDHESEHACSEPAIVKRKFIATMQEVHEAFDSINTLRYSQPTHLQGQPLKRPLWQPTF